jgi:hypothetical protein
MRPWSDAGAPWDFGLLCAKAGCDFNAPSERGIAVVEPRDMLRVAIDIGAARYPVPEQHFRLQSPVG